MRHFVFEILEFLGFNTLFITLSMANIETFFRFLFMFIAGIYTIWKFRTEYKKSKKKK